jgi:hypothetical protein
MLGVKLHTQVVVVVVVCMWGGYEMGHGGQKGRRPE